MLQKRFSFPLKKLFRLNGIHRLDVTRQIAYSVT